MWGGGSATSAANSAALHNQEGSVAGEVNTARLGALLNVGPGATIQAIGSQTIVSTTVYGNNNSTTVTSTQTAINSGTVSNNGSIATNATNSP